MAAVPLSRPEHMQIQRRRVNGMPGPLAPSARGPNKLLASEYGRAGSSNHLAKNSRHLGRREGAQRLRPYIAACRDAERQGGRRLVVRSLDDRYDVVGPDRPVHVLDRHAGVTSHRLKLVGPIDRVFGVVNAFVGEVR